MGVGRIGLWAGLGWLLLPSGADAHDFATRTAAHRLQIVVDVDQIRVDYTVEAPFATAVTPSATGRSLDVQTPDEVTSGLLLLVDGVAVPLLPDPDQRPRVRASAHTEAIRAWLVAEAPVAPEATIEVSNANYPDLAGQFWTEVWLGPTVDAIESDLLPDGPDGRDLDGSWRTDEAARRARVEVHLRRGVLAEGWAWLGGLDQLRPLAQASPSTLRSFWTRGTLRPGEFLGLVALAVALAAVLRAGLAEDPVRVRIGQGLVAVLPAILLVATPPGIHPALELGCGVLALGLAAYAARSGPARWALLGGLLASAVVTQRPGQAALLGAIVVVTLAAPPIHLLRAPARRLAVTLVTVAGLLAVARGIAVVWSPG